MKITSHDNAPHRENRLKKALQIALEISGLTYDQAQLLIVEMRDDKGTLRILWNHVPPSHRQLEAFSTAWELCGEKAASVKHDYTGNDVF